MNKKLMLAASTAAVVGVSGLAGLGVVSAQSQTSGQNTLVDKIAQKFNLNKQEVQKVFEEDRTAHESEHKAKAEERLAAAVKDGKLTQSQADQLKAKMQELETLRDSLKDKTMEEKHTAMKAKMQELRQWLSDNNIPKGLAGPTRVHGGPRGGDDMPPPVEDNAN